ncbi:MAG: glycosyltransferase family 2 protein [Blastomonas sp.]
MSADTVSPGISIVITSYAGLAPCLFLEEVIALREHHDLDVIVVDAARDFVHGGTAEFRHVSCPGRTIQGMMAEGIRLARHDWVLITEDHCRPMPGLIHAYLQAIADHPEIDLHGGSVANLTTTSPWSHAAFVTGLGDHWSAAGDMAAGATNANMLIRRTAILGEELDRPAALLNITVPRLVGSGRYRPCPEAIVDHVVALKGLEAVTFVTHCTLESAADRRMVEPRLPLGRSLYRALAGFLWCAWLHPLHVFGQLRKASQFSIAMALRVLVIGTGVGLARMKADLAHAIARR